MSELTKCICGAGKWADIHAKGCPAVAHVKNEQELIDEAWERHKATVSGRRADAEGGMSIWDDSAHPDTEQVRILRARVAELEGQSSDKTDWCLCCGRGWSWVDGNVHAKAVARVAELEARVRPVNGYGIALMMIAEGVSDPRQLAKDTLAKWRPIINAGIST